jgi:hypothetical protein
MLLVLASECDWRGPLLCERWASAGARLMTPRDLQRSGWRHEPARPLDGIAVAGGNPLRVRDVAGVCTLLPCVTEADVTGVRAADRAYVAGEMTAFLCAWLDALDCPLINRPTPACLCGPAWGPDRWRHAAKAAGLATAEGTGPGVVVVGRHVFGSEHPAQAAVARTLARANGLALLRVTLTGAPDAPDVAGGEVWLDARDGEIADAARELLEVGS